MAIPETSKALEYKITESPTKTYAIDYENKRIASKKDGLAAMVQAVRKALETQRYSETIYSGDYGSELHTLIGKPKAYTRAKLRMLIEEALSADERIRGIKSLNITDGEQDTVEAVVTILTDYGELTISETIGG